MKHWGQSLYELHYINMLVQLWEALFCAISLGLTCILNVWFSLDQHSNLSSFFFSSVIKKKKKTWRQRDGHSSRKAQETLNFGNGFPLTISFIITRHKLCLPTHKLRVTKSEKRQSQSPKVRRKRHKQAETEGATYWWWWWWWWRWLMTVALKNWPVLTESFSLNESERTTGGLCSYLSKKNHYRSPWSFSRSILGC